MASNDVYYRIYREMLDAVAPLNKYKYFVDELVKADSGEDVHSGSISYREIDMDWVEAIEKAIPFIDGAIRERRRFIRVDEDIVPIERSRKITNESIRHLAQHTNMIARVEGDEVTPEKILNLFREESFAIYENRFLKTLLDNAVMFVEQRYSALASVKDMTVADLQMNRAIKIGQEDINFKLSYFSEYIAREKFDIHEDVSKLSGFERIYRIRKNLTDFTASPLMRDLSKAERVRPPITRTNVITKDPNFREVLNLWIFLESYTKQGYRTVSKEATGAMEKPMQKGIYDVMSLMRFVVRLNLSEPLEEMLRGNYEAENRRRKEEAERLEQERRRKEELRLREALENQKKEYEKRIEALTEEYEGKIASLKEEYEGKIAALTEEYERKIADLTEEYERKIADLTEEYEGKIADLKSRHAEEIAALTAEYEGKIADLETRHKSEIASLTASYEGKLEAQRREHESALAGLKALYENKLAEENERGQNELAAQRADYEQRIETDRRTHEAALADQKKRYEDVIAANLADFSAKFNAKCEEMATALKEKDDVFNTTVSGIRAENDKKISDMTAEHTRQLADKDSFHSSEMSKLQQSLKSQFSSEKSALEMRLADAVAECRETSRRGKAEFDRMNGSWQNRYDAMVTTLDTQSELRRQVEERNRELESRVAALTKEVNAARKAADVSEKRRVQDFEKNRRSLERAQMKFRKALEKQDKKYQRQLARAERKLKSKGADVEPPAISGGQNGNDTDENRLSYKTGKAGEGGMTLAKKKLRNSVIILASSLLSLIAVAFAWFYSLRSGKAESLDFVSVHSFDVEPPLQSSASTPTSSTSATRGILTLRRSPGWDTRIRTAS